MSRRGWCVLMGAVLAAALGCERSATPGSEVKVRAEEPGGLDGLSSLRGERWRSRPVLVFAGTGHDGLRDAQLRLLDAASDGVRERDIVVYVVDADGVTRGGETLAGDSDGLRSRYGIAADGWAVVLIGKDGGEKLRVTEGALETELLFAVIDAMPMRRAEMRD
ncbi:MAG: DUF4174 domain-containing protein [Planctomycetota bacterium]